jgi:hypothetical protein
MIDLAHATEVPVDRRAAGRVVGSISRPTGRGRSFLSRIAGGGDSFVRVLLEDLAADRHHCDLLNPLQQTIVIREREDFILPPFLGPSARSARGESIEVRLFSEVASLQALLSPEKPAAEVILDTLFSFLRSGQFPDQTADAGITVTAQVGTGRRLGWLRVCHEVDGLPRSSVLRWQLKGAT